MGRSHVKARSSITLSMYQLQKVDAHLIRVEVLLSPISRHKTFRTPLVLAPRQRMSRSLIN